MAQYTYITRLLNSNIAYSYTAVTKKSLSNSPFPHTRLVAKNSFIGSLWQLVLDFLHTVQY